MKATRLLALAGLVSLGGCGANFHSIYRHEVVTPPSITMVDAKQRAILANGVEPAVHGEPKLRFCAEPSPDVFSVIAQAVSGGASFGQGGDPKSIEAALNAAFSASEQGSTIPRTQTTNMLREVMYRTCERYLSGGISSVELSLQALRDQRLIVSILAIEQLTGVVTPKPVVIGASSNGSSGSTGSESVVRLDEQNKLVQKSTGALKTKQDAYDKLNVNGDSKDCELIAKAATDKKLDALADELKDKQADCTVATAELDAARKDKAAADAHYKALVTASVGGGVPVVVAGTLMTPVASGGLDGTPASDIAQVALVVKDIVASTFGQDEFLFLCLKVLKDERENTLGELSATCLAYVKSKLDLEQKRNAAAADEIVAARKVIQARVDGQFGQFWSLVSTADALDPAKLAALRSRVDPKVWPGCFAAATAKVEFQSCFNAQIADRRRKLAKEGN